jgi:hypothetical protein
MAGERGKVGHFSDDAGALEFIGSHDFARLAAIGTSCPDHFLRTKIAPLALDPAKLDDDAYLAARSRLSRGLCRLLQRCAEPGDPAMRDPNPVVVLVPGIGRITFAADKATARLAGEFYGNADQRHARRRGDRRLCRPARAGSLDIEYWALEEAKLQRMPKPKPLVGKHRAGHRRRGRHRRGDGHAACSGRRLRDAGRPRCRRSARRSAFAARWPRRSARIWCAPDLRRHRRSSGAAAFEACTREFGGLDILVANAGIASSAPIEETTVALWRKNYDVLAEGYFLTSRRPSR